MMKYKNGRIPIYPMRRIKDFLKNKLPRATRGYHKARLFLRSLAEYPLTRYVYIEDTDIKVPIHNPDVYGFSIGGGQIIGGRLYYETDLIGVFKEMIRGKKVFFDVGAHIGYWSYIASYQKMKVAALEPVRSRSNVITKTKNRHHLEIIVAPNGNRIDEFTARTNLIPDFIKIDVDGEEPEIIKGAIVTLTRYMPDLMIEVRKETSWLIDELKKLGYEFHANETFVRVDMVKPGVLYSKEDFKKDSSPSVFFRVKMNGKWKESWHNKHLADIYRRARKAMPVRNHFTNNMGRFQTDHSKN